MRRAVSKRERWKPGKPVEKPLSSCTVLEMITAQHYEEKERNDYDFI